MKKKYYIVYHPLCFDLMGKIGEPGFTPVTLLSFLSGLDTSGLNRTTYLDFLRFDLAKERKGLMEHVGMEQYASYYIANQIAGIESPCEVIIADGKRRPVDDIIREMGNTPAAVFISSLSSNFPAAAASAIALNHAGIPVIIGGIHVSTRPEDVQLFIRQFSPFPELITQVRGPGDSKVLANVLQDLKNNTIKPEYTGSLTIEDGVWGKSNVKSPPPMKLPFLRKLPAIGHVLSAVCRIQVTTPFLGCPYSCKFCSISTLPHHQRKLIARAPDDFVNEIRAIQEHGITYKNRFFMFLPDNLLLGGTRLEAALDKLIASDVKVNYISQASIDIASREDLLKKLRLSGATHLFIGLESLELKNLEAINKNTVPEIKKSGLSVEEYYSKQIHAIQRHGISVHGAFIFGLPHDYFHSLQDHTGRDVSRFCKKNVIGIQAACLNDLPGSVNFEESINSNLYLYGKPGTMDYLLALSCSDLMECNRIPPAALKHSPLVVLYMAYDAAQRVNATRQILPMALQMAKNAWISPSKCGKKSVGDRIADSIAAAGFMLGVSAYKDHFESVAYSRPGYRGTFERLYDMEKNQEVKDLFRNYVKPFKPHPGRNRD